MSARQCIQCILVTPCSTVGLAFEMRRTMQTHDIVGNPSITGLCLGYERNATVRLTQTFLRHH